jgi:hypothetical protein
VSYVSKFKMKVYCLGYTFIRILLSSMDHLFFVFFIELWNYTQLLKCVLLTEVEIISHINFFSSF